MGRWGRLHLCQCYENRNWNGDVSFWMDVYRALYSRVWARKSPELDGWQVQWSQYSYFGEAAGGTCVHGWVAMKIMKCIIQFNQVTSYDLCKLKLFSVVVYSIYNMLRAAMRSTISPNDDEWMMDSARGRIIMFVVKTPTKRIQLARRMTDDDNWEGWRSS